MNKNLSHHHHEGNQGYTMSKSISTRAIYINQQTSKKQVQTHFHSPYKNGRPNKDYCNPSFISSHLFYPKELHSHNQKIIVRPNIIPNANDIKRLEFSKERLNTEHNMELSKSQKKHYHKKRDRQFIVPHNMARISRFNQPQKILKNELSILHNYRQKIQQQVSKTIEPQKVDYLKDYPPYLQKQYRNIKYHEQIQVNKNKNMLSKSINSNMQAKDVKKGLIKRQIEKQNDRFTVLMEQNRRNNELFGKDMKKKSELLGNILRQQMKTNRFIKDRQYNG